MSILYGSLTGSAKTTATRRGNKVSGITAHVRGWDIGIKVDGTVNKAGKIDFHIYKTTGSNGTGNMELVKIISEK